MNEGETQVDGISPLRFLSAANRDALNVFQELGSTIMAEGFLSSKEKLLIALACTVAVKCEVAGLICGGSGFASASTVLEVAK